jgi:hypothetical protein
MRIRFERRGGFTGIPLAATINLDELPDTEKQRIEGLVTAADFFSQQSVPASPRPDQFRYTLTVDSEEKSHTVSVDESTAPPALRSLIQAIMPLAQLRRTG